MQIGGHYDFSLLVHLARKWMQMYPNLTIFPLRWYQGKKAGKSRISNSTKIINIMLLLWIAPHFKMKYKVFQPQVVVLLRSICKSWYEARWISSLNKKLCNFGKLWKLEVSTFLYSYVCVLSIWDKKMNDLMRLPEKPTSTNRFTMLQKFQSLFSRNANYRFLTKIS